MYDSRVLQTQRLTLRPLCEGDIALLYAIQSNQDAMRYTYVAPSLEECSRRLCGYEDSRQSLGFAPWVVVDRTEGRVFGWGGLSIDPHDPGWGPEVSYFFDPAYWGIGYATELVASTLRHAFHELSLSQVSAFAMPDNLASIQVLQKCGFIFLRHEPTLKRNHYQIRAPHAV